MIPSLAEQAADLFDNDDGIRVLVQRAVGAVSCSRRERGRALHVLLEVAQRHPAFPELVALMAAMAWREALGALIVTGSDGTELLGNIAEDLRRELKGAAS